MKHQYKGWEIEGVGGFCTIQHFWAKKDGLAFWRFKLKEAKMSIDYLEKGMAFEVLEPLYRKSLYI